ncbi:ABC transporter substrate-binding protein [Sulfurimonas sp.]|uniref:ABC transporter substrate-binding protein n=1 Tax=Sulfurimonas sp. TaxID=2022749 RepID=UPI003D09DAFD
MKYLLILFVFFFSLNAQTIEPKKLDEVSLQLHWKYQFEFAGFIAAKEKGFYEDVGLDVELKEYKTGTNIEKDVLNGISTYGIYNSSTLIDYLKGKPLKLVASFFKRAALVLIVKPTIQSPQDLVGKKIMSSTKEDFVLNFKPFLDSYNVNVDEMFLTNHTYSIDDFVNGKVDGMTAFISDQVHQLNHRGIKYNILDLSNDNLYVLQMELFTSKFETQNHPTRVINFRNASIKGWQYALEHEDEIIDIIHKKYAPYISKNDLRYEAKGVKKLILPYTYDIGAVDKNFLNKQMAFFKKQYSLNPSKELDDFIFNYEYIDKTLLFSEEEKRYVKKHSVVNVCIKHDQFPIDGMKNGKMTGIMSDIFNDISQTTSLSFEPIYVSYEKDLENKLEDNECQILSIYEKSATQYSMLKQTTPVTSFHFTLISKLDKSFVSSLDKLKNEIIVVQKELYKQHLLSLYPYLHIVAEPNKNKMVTMVKSSKIYAIASLDYQADYIIDKYGYGELKINGFLAKESPLQISIGVQKNDPVLYNIIEKSLKKISKERIENILNEWRITRYQQTIDYMLVWKIAFFMGSILLIMFYYQRKLKLFNKNLESKVKLQTKKLIEYNHSLEKSVQEKVEELIEKDEILTSQSKQAVMGEMISMIAHQWRQPLNNITLQIANLQLKNLLEVKIDKEEMEKTFEEINSAIMYLSETIDDFKTYFRKDKECVDVALEELIHKAINLIKPRVGNIDIHVDIYDDITMQVYVNELVQVLLNILNNAIDAYKNSTSTNKKINISLRNQNNMYIITIEDFAGGIKKENLERLFEPYFSTKGKNGTGLGLYMSQMIIEKQFSGTITVETEDIRTIFKIKLPISCPVLPSKAQEGYSNHRC